MEPINEIKELVRVLNNAAKAYYQEKQEIMSNLEYDRLYDRLLLLEKQTKIVLANSPTQKVGYEVLSSLPKENHTYPMLSLDKTKSVDDLKDWLGSKKGLLSWKLDGLTVVMTYNNGELVKAVTRGNGITGEVITNNARVFKNIPAKIPFERNLVIRGEAVIKYSDFYEINEHLEKDEQYKNPRNLCSGSVRQLNNQITADRNVNFFAFQLVEAENIIFNDSKFEQLKWLESQGFETVESSFVTSENLEEIVEKFKRKISDNDIGSDGLVITFDSVQYSETLGATSKFPKHSLAFKWKDEIAQTNLLKIEWSASRTGLINPIAVFVPVEIEGTTVSRASVHNLSILEELELGEGDLIEVYKANMIIPQIASNITKSNSIKIPKSCPVCNEIAETKNLNGVKQLYCTNIDCPAKKIKAFSHFVSRDALNIEGLSEAGIEKLVQNGLLHSLEDIFKLKDKKSIIVNMEGFGIKSYENLIISIEKARKVKLPNLIYALGIANIGLANAKLICKHFNNNMDLILNAKQEELVNIEGFGEMIAKAVTAYFGEEKNIKVIKALEKELILVKEESLIKEQKLTGKTFVITGELVEYKNRNELKNHIEALGGKIASAVSSKTDYLINNDINSNSSKNKKAKQLGVEIIDEKGFLQLIN